MPPLRLLAYALPGAGFAFYLFFVQFYYLKFATDVLLAPPAVMGVLFGAGRIWDAISDPLVGTWSDRTRSALGRRRPWMLAGIPLLALSFAAVWSPPHALEGGALVIWAAFSLVAFYTAYTIYSVPHQSLGAELSMDHHERSRIFGGYRMAFVIGMMFAFAGIDRVANAADPRAAASVFAIAAGLAVSFLLLTAPVGLREPAQHRGRGAAHPFTALRDVARNPHARPLLAAHFVESLGSGSLGVLAPFVAEYVLRRPDLIGVVPAFYVVAGVVSIPIWVVLSRRFGKRTVWRFAVTGTGLCFGGTFFVGEGDVALLCALLAGAGFAGGCGGVIGASMLADVIDYDELQSGQRKEGAYSAAWGFVLKLAIGGVVALTGIALQLADFRPNQTQSATADFVLRGMFAGIPMLASLCAVLVIRRFRFDQTAHARVRAELDARQGAGD